MIKKLKIKNLDCANCALKLERLISKIEGVYNVNINFMSESMTIDFNEENKEQIIKEINKAKNKVEPDCEIQGF